MHDLEAYRAVLRAQKPSAFKVYARETCRVLGIGLIGYMLLVYCHVLA